MSALENMVRGKEIELIQLRDEEAQRLSALEERIVQSIRCVSYAFRGFSYLVFASVKSDLNLLCVWHGRNEIGKSRSDAKRGS